MLCSAFDKLRFSGETLGPGLGKGLARTVANLTGRGGGVTIRLSATDSEPLLQRLPSSEVGRSFFAIFLRCSGPGIPKEPLNNSLNAGAFTSSFLRKQEPRSTTFQVPAFAGTTGRDKHPGHGLIQRFPKKAERQLLPVTRLPAELAAQRKGPPPNSGWRTFTLQPLGLGLGLVQPC